MDYDSVQTRSTRFPTPSTRDCINPVSFKNALYLTRGGTYREVLDNEVRLQPVQNLNYLMYRSVGYPLRTISIWDEVVASRFKYGSVTRGMLYTGRTWKYSNSGLATTRILDGVLDDWEYVGRYRIVKPSSVIRGKQRSESRTRVHALSRKSAIHKTIPPFKV